MAPRRCCAILHATSFEWQSPKAASSGSITTVSPSATSIAHRGAGTQRASTARVHAPLPATRAAERAAQGALLRALASLPARSCCARPSALGARSVGSPRTEAGGRRSRRYGERLFRSIAVLAATPLPVLQGRPPRVCAQAIPQTGTWTMTRWNERQRLRLRVPVTPRIAATQTLPFSGGPARIGSDASAITRPNHRARHYHTAAQPTAPRETAITSLRGHLENP